MITFMNHGLLLSCLALALASSPRAVRAESAPLLEPMQIDLLLVIDSSSSMAGAQARLAAQLQALVAAIDPTQWSSTGHSLHLAVITTDMGTGEFATCGPGQGGAFQATPRGDCTGPTDAFLIDELDDSGQITRNYEGTLADALQCIAPVGDQGCDFTQPLAAIKAALDGSNEGNSGFLRDDAVLAILIVTDGDDCSAMDPAIFDPEPGELLGPPGTFRCFEQGVLCDQPITREAGSYTGCSPRSDSPYLADPQSTVDFLKQLEFDPTKIVFGTISGEANPVSVELDEQESPQLVAACSDGVIAAEPAPRLRWVTEQFRGVTTDTCVPSYVEMFRAFGNAVRDAAFGLNRPDADAGPDSGPGIPDGGIGGDGGGGCGCSSSDGSRHAPGTALLALLALALVTLPRSRPWCPRTSSRRPGTRKFI